LFLGERIESIAIFAIVLLNAVLGFIQEYRAEKAIEALKKISAPTARVLRDGEEQKIPAREVVLGDILLLEAGDIVPEDSRLMEETSLQIDEASLTGESIPSKKVLEPFKLGTSVADQENMVLWINLVTDGLPALALSVDPADPNIMEHRPRSHKDNIISNPIIARMVLVGVVMMIGTLTIFKFYDPESNLAYAQTVAFSTLMFFQMFNVLNCRSEFNSLFKIGFFTNMKLLGAILISVLMQILVIHTPLGTFFKTVPLTLTDWFYIILVSSSVLIIVEIYKFVVNRVRPDLVG